MNSGIILVSCTELLTLLIGRCNCFSQELIFPFKFCLLFKFIPHRSVSDNASLSIQYEAVVTHNPYRFHKYGSLCSHGRNIALRFISFASIIGRFRDRMLKSANHWIC